MLDRPLVVLMMTVLLFVQPCIVEAGPLCRLLGRCGRVVFRGAARAVPPYRRSLRGDQAVERAPSCANGQCTTPLPSDGAFIRPVPHDGPVLVSEPITDDEPILQVTLGSIASSISENEPLAPPE